MEIWQNNHIGFGVIRKDYPSFGYAIRIISNFLPRIAPNFGRFCYQIREPGGSISLVNLNWQIRFRHEISGNYTRVAKLGIKKTINCVLFKKKRTSSGR